jgi:membrane protease YdiL (CAAX protease family)
MLGMTTVLNLICIPLFWVMYQDDACKRRRREAEESREKLPMNPSVVIWVVCGTAALAFLSSEFLTSLTWLIDFSEGYQEINDAIQADSLLMQLLAAVVVGPVLEELLMRGLLFGRLKDLMPAKAAIVCSAVAFGIIHGNLVQGLHGFLIGLLLAWLMERFDNLWVPILAHMAANLGTLLVIPAGNAVSYVLQILVCIALVLRTIQILNQREN